MDIEQLKSTLRLLHEELNRGEAIDPETVTLLQQLADDIDELAARAAIGTERQGLLDRLLDFSEGFEESHPRLARAIGSVAEALSRLGI